MRSFCVVILKELNLFGRSLIEIAFKRFWSMKNYVIDLLFNQVLCFKLELQACVIQSNLLYIGNKYNIIINYDNVM